MEPAATPDDVLVLREPTPDRDPHANADLLTVVQLEEAVWPHAPLWHAVVDHLRDRFSRVQPLPHPLHDEASGSDATARIAADVSALDRWARSGTNLDWRAAARRFIDEHAPLYVRTDPRLSRALRQIARSGPLYVFTALPPELALAVLRHLGLERAVDRIERVDTDLASQPDDRFPQRDGLSLMRITTPANVDEALARASASST